MESLVEITSRKGCQLLIIKRVYRGSSSSILLVTLLEHPLLVLVTSILSIMYNAFIHSLGCLSTLIGLTISVCLLYLLGISISLNEY